MIDPDTLEIRRLLESIRRDGLHLHRQNIPGPAGLAYRWTVMTGDPRMGHNQDGTLKGKGGRTCGTLRCFRLKLRNVVPAE